MLNQRHEIAQGIAAELLPAEREVDSAIIRNSKLAIAVVEGRRKCKLPLGTGQEGLNMIANATVRLVEARELLAQAHSAFRATQDEVGLKAFSYGDLGECPPSTGEAAPGPLSIVA